MQHEDSFKTILYLGDKLFLKFLFPFSLLGCTECEGNWKVFSLIFVTRANSNISFLLSSGMKYKLCSINIFATSG